MKRAWRDALGVVVVTGAAGMGGLEQTASAQATGADVTYQNFTNTTNHGVIGGVRAYMYSSDTCNIGTANLRWGPTHAGSPALAQNLYRIHDGRMVQLGMSWCKQACCAASSSGCGTCNGTGGSQLGAGCRDTYSAGYNAGQTRLGPRSAHNAWTGAMTIAPTNTGNAVFKRLQVQESDMLAANFPGALYIAEGVYVASDDAEARNHYNNASWKPVTVDPTSRNLSSTGVMNQGQPAIYAWQVNDPTVTIRMVDVPSEGRFYVASKVSKVADTQWRYEYAVFNLNSDRSAGGLFIPAVSGVTVSNVGFRDVDYHSGEVYDNADWATLRTGAGMNWQSPQTFTQNPNSNAIRWGTMYNFWFTANTPPRAGEGVLSLFKPHTPGDVSFPVSVPATPCPADFDGDAVAGTDFDVEAFFRCLSGNCCTQCFPADYNLDGDVGTDADIEGFFRVLAGQAC